MIDHLFVFSDTVSVDGSLTLNIVQGYYEITFNEQIARINMNDLKDDCVTMVMYNNYLDRMYCLYNFKQVAQVFGMKNSDVLKYTKHNAFVQIDQKRSVPFIKVFLPKDQYTLCSDTHDFSDNCHVIKDFIHPLDWHYCATYDLLHVVKQGNLINVLMDVVPSFSGEKVFLNYGRQVYSLESGENKLMLSYCPGEKIYVGSPNSRYEGHAIDVEQLCTVS